MSGHEILGNLEKTVPVYEPIGPARKLPIVGLRDIVEMVRTRIAPYNQYVLITGKSGTGKDLLAREIHDASPKKDEPFVVLMPPVASDQERFFGEAMGYQFRSGKMVKRAKGVFERATEGTVFIDEIDLFPLETQYSLARILQERIVHPLKSHDTVEIKCRVIAATHADLRQLAKDGKFLQELLYAIDKLNVDVPSLSDRQDEISALVEYFIKQKYAGINGPKDISREALQMLLAYNWPGNVRQLESAMERCCAVSAKEKSIEVPDLPAEIRKFAEAIPNLHDPVARLVNAVLSGIDIEALRIQIETSSWRTDLLETLIDKVTAGIIKKVLEACGGDIAAAARILGISPKTLLRKMK